jgi:hypothetical protein
VTFIFCHLSGPQRLRRTESEKKQLSTIRDLRICSLSSEDLKETEEVLVSIIIITQPGKNNRSELLTFRPPPEPAGL